MQPARQQTVLNRAKKNQKITNAISKMLTGERDHTQIRATNVTANTKSMSAVSPCPKERVEPTSETSETRMHVQGN